MAVGEGRGVGGGGVTEVHVCVVSKCYVYSVTDTCVFATQLFSPPLAYAPRTASVSIHMHAQWLEFGQ